MPFKYALFDLDGTLSESAPGIVKCVQYALHKVGIEEPDLTRLEAFVGPPLNVEFKEMYDLDPETIEKAVDYFRERYAVDGIFDCNVYDGIPEMLKKCRESGMTLAVASNKPEPYVRQILEHFGIVQEFEVICGSRMEDERASAGNDAKAIIVKRALQGLLPQEEQSGRKELCAMVGDRRYDIEGALANGVAAVGVTFGYGTEQELLEAGADRIAHTPEQLAEILLED